MKKIDNKEELRKMIEKYLGGRATPEQEEFLDEYFQYFDQQEDILQQFSETEKADLRDEIESEILKKISNTPTLYLKNYRFLLKIAAVLTVFLSIGFYLYFTNKSDAVLSETEIQTQKIVPGGNKALLTLADGSKISLDDANIGKLTQQGNTVITKTSDGELIYDLLDKNKAIAETNIIETPRGGEYQVVLPDGTHVWLNAVSKLIFPTFFKGKERQVELVGEAYFEVAKNKSMPFIINSGKQKVEVLGTHFNINAYPDEEVITTTLLEGSVRVSGLKANKFKLLKPGEQSVLTNNGEIEISAVNAFNAIAWKNGYFIFSNESIESVMRKISRWYNVEVVYDRDITNESFVGTVSKFEDIKEVLTTLELTGLVHFKLEERRIVVMK